MWLLSSNWHQHSCHSPASPHMHVMFMKLFVCSGTSVIFCLVLGSAPLSILATQVKQTTNSSASGTKYLFEVINLGKDTHHDFATARFVKLPSSSLDFEFLNSNSSSASPSLPISQSLALSLSRSRSLSLSPLPRSLSLSLFLSLLSHLLRFLLTRFHVYTSG